jgi:hypothetical protein
LQRHRSKPQLRDSRVARWKPLLGPGRALTRSSRQRHFSLCHVLDDASDLTDEGPRFVGAWAGAAISGHACNEAVLRSDHFRQQRVAVRLAVSDVDDFAAPAEVGLNGLDVLPPSV